MDTTGAETFTLVVKDLTTGELLPEAIANTSPGVAWANDNRTLFYVVLDRARRPCSLFRHTLGTEPASDHLVMAPPKPLPTTMASTVSSVMPG